MLSMVLALEAMVLSVGTYSTSLFWQASLVTEAISLESAAVYSFTSRPISFSFAPTTVAWYLEFFSAEQYRMPTFLASGTHSLTMAACLSSGARSAVPVTLIPVLVAVSSFRLKATP